MGATIHRILLVDVDVLLYCCLEMKHVGWVNIIRVGIIDIDVDKDVGI